MESLFQSTNYKVLNCLQHQFAAIWAFEIVLYTLSLFGNRASAELRFSNCHTAASPFSLGATEMKSEIVQDMVETETLRLSKWQRFWHFSIVLFLLIVPTVTTFNLIKDYLTGSYAYRDYPSELFIFGYSWVPLAICLYFLQKRRLRFKSIFIAVDADTFQQAVKQTAKELEWHIVKKTSTLIVARSGFSWRSWGELITIIREKDKVLFNSICDPDNRTSVASWGMNKVNRELFEQYLRQAAPNRSFVK